MAGSAEPRILAKLEGDTSGEAFLTIGRLWIKIEQRNSKTRMNGE
jgi:hypothetical protein